MKTLTTIVLLAAVSMAGCSTCSRESGGDGTAAADKVIAPAVGDTVKLAWDGATGRAVIRKQEGQTILVAFDSGRYGRLDGVLSSDDSTANVRFTQVFMPDGSADGPFGSEMHRDLPAAGRYVVSVGENMMAGDPWGGTFAVELTLSGDIDAVPYTLAEGYFVHNNFNGRGGFKITTQENFNTFFGMAATMGMTPTPIDFTKQFAVAYIALPTDTETRMSVDRVMREDGGVRIYYKEDTGVKQSFTIRPFVLLLIDKKYDAGVKFTKL
ncbi:hypothetical protein LJC45_06120 [Alistipes sp. OttesenSCG-928-B03]|nr:hypothetical protein [Alistipes sp. OttesenSCG-928-B03]